MQQVNICPGGGHTSADGILQHIAGTAGVLAHHDGGTMAPTIVVAQETANLIGVVGSEAYAGLTAETVGSKISSHEIILAFFIGMHQP